MRTSRWRGGAERCLPASRLGAPALCVLLAGAAIVRARYGVDFGDSSHAVALAVRLSQGDVPFRDEMNLQVLGSWPAVPLAWVWLHLVGIDGMVLASRVWFVVVATACGYACWRAVSPLFGRGTAAAALAVALVPTAYNQQVLSYNTTPALLYLLAVCAGVAAVCRPSREWGVVAGCAAVLGATSHPVTAPAAAVLLLLVLVQGRGRVLAGVAFGAGASVLVVSGLALVVWGPSAISDTLAFTEAYQAGRPPLEERFSRWTTYVAEALTSLLGLSALALGLLAAVPRLRPFRAPLLVAAVSLTVVHAFGEPVPGAAVDVWFSGVLGVMLAVVLFPAALAYAVRRRDPVARLVPLGVAPTLVGVPILAAFTSSSPAWGAAAAALAPGLFAVVLAGLAWVGPSRRLAKLSLFGVLLGSLAAVHALNSYRDAPIGALAATLPRGPFAGVQTTLARADTVEQDRLAVELCAGPGDGVLAYHFPSAFLFGDVRFDSPIVWTIAGPSTERVLRWVADTGRVPECVVAARGYWPGFGTNPSLRLTDPLRDWVVAHYRVVSQTSQVVVLRHTG